MKRNFIYSRKSIGRQSIASTILFAFWVTSIVGTNPVFAQDFRLPAPGGMVHLSPEFNPPILKGIKVHPDNPFRFDFILDKGDGQLGNKQLKDESSRLIKYFLASLTIPEKDLWVNLSPYEKDRIIPQTFGLTEMGRDLLAEDYMLKQITASLIYPEDGIGKKFWKRIYEEAEKKFGTTNIPVNTFNKVWIIPEKAVVYENAKAGTAYVVKSKLKVMLEQDYLSLQKHAETGSEVKAQGKETNQLGSQIVREIVIPELTKEVNENKNFSQLRQVYNSLILATWYKKKIKNSILEQVYTDKNKVAGVNVDDPQEKQKIYNRYLQAFKKGVYNYIKEEVDPVTQQPIPKKYFSGGIQATNLSDAAMTIIHQIDSAQLKTEEPTVEITAELKRFGLDASMMATVFDNMPYQPTWLTQKIKNAFFKELPALDTFIAPFFKKSYYFSSVLTHNVQSGSNDYQGALSIVRNGPDFNHLKEYPKSGRAFWTNIGPWQGHLTHSPILQLSFEGQVIGHETEDEIWKQLNIFLSQNMKSVQYMLPRERFSLTEDDYELTRYLFDIEAVINHVDAVRLTESKPLPLDWLLIKNPNAIKEITMVTGGVDAPENWREEAVLARQQKTRVTPDEAMQSNDNIDSTIEGWIDGKNEPMILRASDGAIFKFVHHVGEGREINQHQIDVVSNEQKIGYIHFEIMPQSNRPISAWMEESFWLYEGTYRHLSTRRAAIFVDPEISNNKLGKYKGVGRSLLGLAERLAYLKGAQRFYAAEVGWGNFENFYKRLGYYDAELAPFYDLHQTVVKDLNESSFSRIAIEQIRNSAPTAPAIKSGDQAMQVIDIVGMVVGAVGAAWSMYKFGSWPFSKPAVNKRAKVITHLKETPEKRVSVGSLEWRQFQNLVAEAKKDPHIAGSKFLRDVEAFERASKNALYNLSGDTVGFCRGVVQGGVYRHSEAGINLEFINRLLSKANIDPAYKYLAFGLLIKEGSTALHQEESADFHVKVAKMIQKIQEPDKLSDDDLMRYIAMQVEGESIGYRADTEFLFSIYRKNPSGKFMTLMEKDSGDLKGYLQRYAVFLFSATGPDRKSREQYLRASVFMITVSTIINERLKERFDKMMEEKYGKVVMQRVHKLEFIGNPRILKPLLFLNEQKFYSPDMKDIDNAQITKINTGGIDLTPANMHLQTQNSNGEIKFHLNPAMLKQLQNAPGFVPVIINIQPMNDIRGFLNGVGAA